MAIVDVSEIRKDTGIEDPNTIEDTQIQEFIEQEESILKSEIGTLYENDNVEEWFDGDGTDLLYLNYTPVTNIISFQIDNTEISSDDYYLYPETGKIMLKNITFNSGFRNIYVSYEYNNSVKNKIAKQIVHDLVCIRVFLFVGAKISEGIESEKLDNYTLKFNGKPYNSIIEDLKENVRNNLAKLNISYSIV